MKMKMLARSAVAAAAVGGATVIMAAPASANVCASGNVCMWEDANYTGSKYVDIVGRPGTYDIDWWNGDNEITSIKNPTNLYLDLYDNDNCTGHLGRVNPYSNASDLPWMVDDRAECFILHY
jgi:hypothetical protein